MRNLVIWGAPWLRDRLAARGFACDSLRPEAVLVFVADDDDLDAIRRMTAKHAAITLTARERDVLRYLVEGHTLAEIADELDIGFYTVQSHVKHIYRKLGVGSKAAATAAALRYQLV